MGQSTQRTPRLHFRTPGIPWKNANGTGPRGHRRARTFAGKSCSQRSRKSCCLARCNWHFSRTGYVAIDTSLARSTIAWTSKYALNSTRRITRDFVCAELTFRFVFTKCNAAARAAHRGRFAITRTNGEHHSGGTSPVAPSAQTPGAPWPVQTAGLPPLYSAAWHHVHLYAPRSINRDSNMPSYRFLYEKRRIAGERSADALQLSSADAPPEGWEVVPSYGAKCLVAYLMGLNQSHPLKDVRSVGGAPAAAASPATAAQGASPSPAAASPAAAKK